MLQIEPHGLYVGSLSDCKSHLIHFNSKYIVTTQIYEKLGQGGRSVLPSLLHVYFLRGYAERTCLAIGKIQIL